jgi:hypothetical protein
MEKQTAEMVVPWVALMAGVVSRDVVGLILAGLIWLPQVRSEGRQRTLAVCGLLLLVAIAGLVAWVRMGA